MGGNLEMAFGSMASLRAVSSRKLLEDTARLENDDVHVGS